MLHDRHRTKLRLQNLQGQSIQQAQEPVGINWGLILAAVGGIALVAAAARRQSSTSERVTFERNPAPVAGISESATIPWGRYAVAGLAGYLGGKLIETSLSIPVMSQGPPSPSTLVAPPRGPVQNPNRAGGQIDWSSVLFGPALKAIDTTGASVTPPIPIWTPPSDYQWLSLIRHPAVVLTIGSRGAGKSALNYCLLELLRCHWDPYIVGLPTRAHKYLPNCLGTQDRLEDVPRGAVVLLDESYLQLHSRASMNQAGRSIGNLINLSRQNRQTLLFVVPDARQLDVNVVS